MSKIEKISFLYLIMLFTFAGVIRLAFYFFEATFKNSQLAQHIVSRGGLP